MPIKPTASKVTQGGKLHPLLVKAKISMPKLPIFQKGNEQELARFQPLLVEYENHLQNILLKDKNIYPLDLAHLNVDDKVKAHLAKHPSLIDLYNLQLKNEIEKIIRKRLTGLIALCEILSIPDIEKKN